MKNTKTCPNEASRLIAIGTARFKIDLVIQCRKLGAGTGQPIRWHYSSRHCKVAKRPETDNPASDLRQGYARRLTGSHIIFYRITDGGVDVVRVLHQSMDFDRHL
jgi:hypothetical protein